MPVYSVWMLEKSNISVSGGGTLDGVTQGTGVHLIGSTITLLNRDWLETFIDDQDLDFEDNDPSIQRLASAQVINGVSYGINTRVEAEYRITLTDGTTTWTAISYNVNNSLPNAYSTIEGLVFLPAEDGSYPPPNVALTVLTAGEGPSGAGSNPYILYDTPPCFTPGTLIDTPLGAVAVEALQVGDLVTTRDHGPQALRWIGRVTLSPAHLARHPEHRPIALAAGAVAPGLPQRTLCLSPQHRLLVTGWMAELFFAEDEVLVPAAALRNDRTIRAEGPQAGVTYLHLLFDRHEIVFAEGAPVESLYAPWIASAPLPPPLRAELEALFPELFAGALPFPARPCLTVTEGRTLAL